MGYNDRVKSYWNDKENMSRKAKQHVIEMDDDFEVINQKNKKEIKLFFRECPGIGLQNIGATCYMNATLQCFAHIEKFVNFLKYNSHSPKSIVLMLLFILFF